MSNQFALNWAATSVSLFNTILLLWLGLTVLLNADHRNWGIWIAGGSLLLGATFFISHSAILGIDLTNIGLGIRFWWYLGLIPIVALPLAWYVIMLWYAGFWDDARTALRRRHRVWLLATLGIAAAGLMVVIIYANPLSSQLSLLPIKLAIQPIGGTPLLATGYAVYLMLCFGLSLDALRRPGPTSRVMGELARKRARSWLVATTLALLLVSILVIVFMLWVLLDVRQEGVYVISSEVLLTLTRFDLLVSSLLAVTIVVLGRAVVAYEIFTGKTLPRRGLWRQWALAVLLSAGYGLVVGWALTAGLRPVYGVLLSAVMMTLFFALLNWRSYADRERYIEHLQPFVASQGLYNQMLQQQVKEPNSIDAKGPFRALCRDVLGSEVGYLLAYGPLELLVDSPLVYPDYQEVSISNLGELIALIKSPQTRSLPVDPLEFSGATWAVPLWSERGLVGIFLLGKKKDGSLYTQEEIEIARASGERLIDIQASSEMSRRLLILQRQRMAETQIVDRKTRLHLHDEVLPQVHTAMLSLSNKTKTDNGATEEVLHLLSDVHRQISDILRELPSSAVSEIDRLGVLIALRRVIENEFGQVFDSVSWNVNEFCERKARTIPPLIAEVLYYATREAIRNAARHGRPLDSGKDLDLCITADWGPDALEILVEDNGVGLASTTTGEKWGGGLSLHGTMMVVIGGSLTMESLPNAYTRAIISLPHNTWEV